MVSSDDAQRLFLQAILSRGILTGKLAQILWEKCIAAVTGYHLSSSFNLRLTKTHSR